MTIVSGQKRWLTGACVLVLIAVTAAGRLISAPQENVDNSPAARVVGDLPSEGQLPIAPPSLPSPSPPPPDLLLPDLLVLPPEELFVTWDEGSGEREMRFSTTLVNRGEGPLQVRGAFNPQTNRTRATQQIVSRKADGVVDRFVGEFVFHEGYDHWHFESFHEFELWTYGSNGSLDQRVATTGKLTFCMMDSDRLPDAPPGTPERPVFGGCDAIFEGISAGWADTYESNLAGQRLDLARVPDGRYAIRSTVDPENRALEIADTNNTSVIYVQLTGDQIERLPGP